MYPGEGDWETENNAQKKIARNQLLTELIGEIK